MDRKIKGDFGQYFLVNSRRLNVAIVLILKSSNGSLYAQSWEGCAAQWIINLIFFL